MAVLTRPFRPTVASSLLLSVAATLYGLVIYYSARPVVRDAPDRLVPTLINDNYLEVDYALDGACYAGTDPNTPHLPPPNSFGAFGPSTNFPRKVCEDSKGKGLFLLAQPDVVMPFDDGKGMRLVLVNQTQKMVELFASDSRLDIVQEGQTSTGEWKPIEYFHTIGCGNSFHTAYLPPNHFWQFGTPRYRGEFQTRLRFALSIDRSHTIYSNEFDGSINLEQIRAAEALSAAMMEFEDEDRSWFTVFMEYLKPKPPSPPITLLPEQPKRPSVEVDPLPPSNERE